MSGLSEQERDSLTECECGHFANEHSSTGCLATDFSEDWRPVRDDDVCSCTHSPSAITRHAVERIKADAVAAAREEARQEALAPLAVAIAEMDAWAKSFHPDNYRTGQDHLPLAFREVNYRAAMNVLMQRFDQFVEGLRPLAADIRKGDDRG